MTYAGDLTPQQAWEFLSDHPEAALVDVRTKAEWDFVGVPVFEEANREVIFAQWNTYPAGIQNQSFLDEITAAGVSEGTPVVFLCRSGARSVAAAEAATAAGLGPAYNILDGFEGATDAAGHRGKTGWRAAGLPWRQA